MEEWERWSAELLESHISYPLLCYFRSQHNNQSWISALTAILDTSALLIAGVRGHEARQAQLTFAMARHAMVDLSQILSLTPDQGCSRPAAPRAIRAALPTALPERRQRLPRRSFHERLREMRNLYEGYAEALSRYLRMPLPPWIADHPHKDNWLAVAKLRARTEAANPPSGEEPKPPAEPQNIIGFIDHHHDF